jgi:hypothetical protein
METNITKSGMDTMHKRRETMADGRRYVIYYTFSNNSNKDESAAPAVDLKFDEKASEAEKLNTETEKNV